LGSGGSGNIFNGILLNEQLRIRYGVTEVAVKVIEITALTAEDRQEKNSCFSYEIAIMSSLHKSPNIVQMIGYTDSPHKSIIMKKYDLSLKDLIGNKQFEITESLLLKISLDIATGLSLIHRSRILHLDIKPNNILVTFNESNEITCAITDFGVSSVMGDSRNVAAGLHKPKYLGITPRYAAPEVRNYYI
jgi:serine/threonine protein kinase